jgi:2-polyprenyl-6-methoxyphenol hydroxylase-like FAD-dependent oxidoreductase
MAAAMTRTRTALIIGGGIAGPATAMALQKAGIDSVIYEAHPGGAEGIGAFLTLASNGVDALHVIDADTPVLAAGFPTPAIVLRSGTGKCLGSGPTGLPGGMPSQTLKRADIYHALHEEAGRRGVRIEHGKRLVDAREAGDAVHAMFADGSEATGDLLIGCDGVHSTLRRIIDPAAPRPYYTGLINTGGYASGVPVDTEPGSYGMIFGKRAFFGYAVAPDREVWWFANVPRREEPARGELTAITSGEWRRRLLELYADDAEDPAACTARATIDASSYDSGNARRDRDVSSPALLDAGRFPDITFTGTGARAEHDSWIVDGSVSAHGATDTIQVRVSEARTEGDGAYFRATARLDRTRLGISGKKGMVGRNVTLSIEARATRV